MKHLSFTLMISLVIVLCPLVGWQDVNAQHSFYDFSVTDIHGDEYDLAQLQGKKVLIVNTASTCGFTPQYEELENLYITYGGEDFTILAFPTNDFGNREPGSNEEIAAFCSSKYKITFPVMAKITVKGDDMHPLYRWLTQASENGVEESRVTWNFQKYMVDEGGTLAGHVSPIKQPDCKEILSWISAE